MSEWRMIVAKADLAEAVGTARRRATLRRRGRRYEPDIVLAAGDDGLSVRSSDAAMDLPGSGSWPSPVTVAGAAFRRLVPKLDGSEVVLSYAEGRLTIGTTMLSAREL